MPVLPEVGSMMVLTPGLILPAFSAASIIETPMRSFTDDIGLKNSSLARISAVTPSRWGRRLRRTRGVAPMVSVMSP